jgi:TPR repeat protein
MTVAEQERGLYRAGYLLVALATLAVGLASLFERWLVVRLESALTIFSFQTFTGATLAVSAVGVAVFGRARGWAALAAAAALLLAARYGVYLYYEIAETRDFLIRIALAGALLMLAGLERSHENGSGRSFRAGRWFFAIFALLCIVDQYLLSQWKQSGFDMFYRNYDPVTLFNSIWSWNYPLGWIFGAIALAGAAALLFRRLARSGALWLAAATILFLPLLFLYRLDDFCGGKEALVELAYEWILDLGLAGGALILAAGFQPPRTEAAGSGRTLASRTAAFCRRKRVRVSAIAAALLLIAALALHGLIPFFFYEANIGGHAQLGDLAARIYAATYVPRHGNSYIAGQLTDGIFAAAPAGRACAAGDPRGCVTMANFYFDLGWNWSRSWNLSARAVSLYVPRCHGGEMEACYRLALQYSAGRGVAADAAQAAGLYEKACAAAVAEACTLIADGYWYGIGVTADKRKGAALMKEACALGGKWACQRLDYMRRYDPDWRPEYDRQGFSQLL